MCGGAFHLARVRVALHVGHVCAVIGAVEVLAVPAIGRADYHAKLVAGAADSRSGAQAVL